MVRKKTVKKTASKKEEEKSFLGSWNREIAMVTAVGAVLIIALSVFSGFYLANLTEASPVVKEGKVSMSDAVCVFNSALSIPLSPIFNCGVDTNSCSAEGKVTMLSFHSPTCGFCVAQEELLNQIKAEYGDKLVVQKVCKPIQEGDEALCAADPSYLSMAESTKLVEAFGLQSDGTPILIIDCEYKRYGSYAARDLQTGSTLEYDDLKKIIDELL